MTMSDKATLTMPVDPTKDQVAETAAFCAR